MAKTQSLRSILWITLVLCLLAALGLRWAMHRPESESREPLVRETPALRPHAPSPAATPAREVSSTQSPDTAAAVLVTTDRDLPPDFLDRIVSEKSVSFTLPDGLPVRGNVDMIQRDPHGVLFVQGRTTSPHPGFYFFQRQTVPGIAGPLVGHVRFDGKTDAWKVEPAPDLASARLVARDLDQIICANYEQIPEAAEGDVENAPQTHPTNIPIPSYQTIIPLQSLPGATAVIYLDFDGEQGPFPGWGDFDAAPATANNSQIFDVWKMVCEDYQGFNVNVTTDRKVFDNAPEGRRTHCIISPTTDAAPGAGGVAYVGSFNWSGDRVCWAFYSTGKSSCEVISHEVGHTLQLSHDGRNSPAEGYYGGHGTDPTGWAPIMGVGYYKKLSQWSKGEYLSANQTQDDLAIIVSNNDVDYRTDDMGDVLSSARYLEILADNTVSNEGIIEQTGDIDSFRFVTAGGTATLNVNTVTLNPNLDILAEIVDAATSTVVASDNPDLGINAAVTANLPAGEYLLRVRGTGRGDVLGDGYSNYGCLGSYLITGTVSGGVKPERFSVAENTANGSAVGTVVPRNNHAGATLAYAITSGNTNGAFTINTSTGAITVANSAALDYEALSLRWDDPATIEMFVTITDSANPSLNETLRTVVTVTKVNEPPALTGGSQTLLEHTLTGTKVLKVSASDPDAYDFPTYSITAGNTGNVFAIDSGTGQITVAADIDVSATTVYNLTVQAADQGTPALTTTAAATITVVNTTAGYQPGRIVRTYFENISGSTVANLTGNAKFPNSPDSEQFLTSFDGTEHADNFGSTIRGYVIPPVTGTYQFWIASDDASDLRIGTNATPASATVKASVSGWTNPYAWTANASQQSATISLTAGQPYYIEARHKEGGGGDHVAVAWSGPGITRQVISGLYLAPYYQNYAPKVTAATFSIRESALAGQPVGTVGATDVNAQDTFGGYTITAGNAAGIFGINAATGQLFVAQSGLLNATTTPSHTLTVQTTDNGTPALSGTGTITVNVTAAAGINISGIVQEIWTGLSGTTLTGLTGSSNYPYKPNTRRTLTSFDSGENYAENYGSRTRVKFIPATSGDHRFYIAGDDDCRLLFSTNASGTGATQIANISGWTNHNEWTKYTSQTSAVKTLVAGQAVYLEALQKEGGGGDHVSVGYTSPDVTAVTVIPGSMLQPFDINTAPVFSPTSYSFTVNAATATTGAVVGTVTATEPNGETVVYAILSGNTAGAFAINPATGAITVTNPALLSNGITTLQLAAQDGGLGGVYPLASGTATATITITGNNTAPSFTSSSFSKPAATENTAYNQTLAGSATDPNSGDTLTFSKTSGPAWLSVASNGTLTGTPADADTGNNSFIVRVTDQIGAFSEATLNIIVIGVNHPPAFTADPIALNAMKNTAFSATLNATDTDTTETLTYTKVSGPSWLGVSANGALTGTPLAANTGTNAFVVRATDPTGLFDEAALNIQVLNEPVWTNPAGGSWPVSGNWLAGLVAAGTGNIADFSTLDLTADTVVTLDGARTIGGLSFSDNTPSHNWTINTGTAGPLTLNAASGEPSINVTNQTATLNSPVAGTQGLTKSGAGILTLGAANSFTGGLVISGGTVRLQSGDYTNTLASGNTVTIQSGGTLAVVNTNTSNSIVGFVVQSGGTLNCQGYHEHLTGVVLNGGTITGTGSGKYNNEDFALDSDLTVGGSTPSSISIANGIGIGSGNRTFTVPDVTASTAADLTVSGAGALRNSGTLVKSGPGTLALNNVNAHGGTVVNKGTLTLGSGGATGTLRGSLTVNAGATVDYTADNTFGYTSGVSVNSLQINGGTVGGANFNQHFWNNFQLGMTGGTLHLGGTTNEWHNATITVNASPTTSRILGVGSTPQMRLRDGTPVTFNTADGPAAVDLSVEVPITQNNGTSAVTKTGAGTMRLTAACTNTGPTTINAGTLLLTGSIGSSATTIAAAATLAGTGTLGGAVITNGTLSPGDVSTPGALTINNSLSLANSSAISWLLSDWTGSAGTGYSRINTSSLVINAAPATPVTIRINAQSLANFTEANNTFTILSSSGAPTGFDPSKFVIDAVGFTAGSGTWSVQQSGNNIVLVYTRANTPPSFTTDPIALNATEDQALVASISANDADSGETLTYAKSGGPSWLTVSSTGVLGGTPGNGDVGTATFTVSVTDSFNASDTATLEITVANVNDAPTFTTLPLAGLSATEDVAFSDTVAGTAIDVDAGDALTYSKTSGPEWLSVASDGTLSGTPSNPDVGPNSFTIRVTDSGALFAETTLEIQVANVNDTPEFTLAPITAPAATEDAAYSASLSALVTDPDAGETLSFTKTSGPAWLSVATDGTLSGTPANSDVGTNVFTMRITDSGGLFSEALLNIDVANTNDAPVFTLPSLTSPDATQDAAYSATVSATATDPDAGDALTYSKTSGPAWLTVASNGSLSGTPASGDTGTNTFTLRATDSGGLFAETTLLIQVIAVNADANANGLLDEWETVKFGNADTGSNAPDADPDGDGMSNLLEYALDTHPLQPNANPLTHDFVTVGADRHLRLSIPKNPLATNLIYTVETSGTPGDWSTADTLVETNTAGGLVVRDTVAVSSQNRRFIRLKVQTQP